MSCSNIRTPSKVAQKITNEVRSEEKEEECFTPRGQKHQSRDGGWRHQKVLTYSRRRFTWNIFATTLGLTLSVFLYLETWMVFCWPKHCAISLLTSVFITHTYLMFTSAQQRPYNTISSYIEAQFFLVLI